MAEAYQHGGDMVDEYRVFVIPTNLTEDKQVAAIELSDRATEKLFTTRSIQL